MTTRTPGWGVTPRSELASMAASRPGVAGSTTTMAWRLASMLVSARTASAEDSTLTPARRSVAARPPRSSSAGSTTRTPPLIGITESYSNAARSGSSSVRWNRPPSSLRGLEDGAVRAAAHQPLAQLPALDLRGEEIALATRGVEERRGQLRLVARVTRHEPRRRLLPGARELHRARQERDALARAVERHAQLLGLRVLGHRRRGLRARRFLQLQLRLGHARGVVEGKSERQADTGQPPAADGAAVPGDEYLRPALRLHFVEQQLLLALIERGEVDACRRRRDGVGVVEIGHGVDRIGVRAAHELLQPRLRVESLQLGVERLRLGGHGLLLPRRGRGAVGLSRAQLANALGHAAEQIEAPLGQEQLREEIERLLEQFVRLVDGVAAEQQRVRLRVRGAAEARGAIDDGDVDGQQRTAAAEVEDAVVAQLDVLCMLRGDVEAECGVRLRGRDHAYGEGRIEAAHGQRAASI